MTDCRKLWHRRRFGHSALVLSLILIATIPPFPSINAAEPITLKIEATSGLLGVHHAALSRYLVVHMTDAKLADWRFEATEGDVAARDRVEWTFRLNPYAGGEVRNIAHALPSERQFGGHRPITIEARLYLNGQYQTLVENQAVVQGGPDDPDLAAAVAKVTDDLLGPSGAYDTHRLRSRVRNGLHAGGRQAPGEVVSLAAPEYRPLFRSSWPMRLSGCNQMINLRKRHIEVA
jgi:hypothetical protein